MSRKIRTPCKRRIEILDAPKEVEETRERGQYSGGRVKKRSLKKPIGDRISKKRVKVSSRPEPSRSSNK